MFSGISPNYVHADSPAGCPVEGESLFTNILIIVF